MKPIHKFLLPAVLLLTACLTPAQAQPHLHAGEDKGVFSYVNNEQGQFATIILKKQHYKYLTAQKVLMDLVEAKGDTRMPIPKLEMTNSERRVAFAKPGEAIIGLESKAYDICSSFGKDSLNALAVILAHELTHYYEKHDWTSHFVSEHEDMDVSDKIKTLNEKMKLETQADYLGGFLAYTAGYPTLDIMPVFLQKIYDVYEFPEKMKGYPDLSERKQIAARTAEKLKNLVQVFETANWLVALGQYEAALEYYHHILLEGQFQSREVYNNMGVLAIQAAIGYFKTNEIKYAYPVELDPVSRMSGPIFRGMEDREKLINTLLKKSIDHFKTALSLDENYTPALLNMACAYALQSAYFDADYHAQKAIQLSVTPEQQNTAFNAKCLLGIIAARQGQAAKADKYFDEAIAQNNVLAKINKSILHEEAVPLKALDTNKRIAEKIDDINLNKVFVQKATKQLTVDQEVAINADIKMSLKNYPLSSLLIHENTSTETQIFLHITAPAYGGQTQKSIGKGSTLTELTEAYQLPQRWISLTSGHYLIYTKQQMVFMMKDGQVQGWCIYKQVSATNN